MSDTVQSFRLFSQINYYHDIFINSYGNYEYTQSFRPYIIDLTAQAVKVPTTFHQNPYDLSAPYVDGYLIQSISGTVDGVPVTGLGNYAGADNIILPTNPDISYRMYRDITLKGITFATGDHNYIVKADASGYSFYSLDTKLGDVGIFPGLTITPVCFCQETLIATSIGDLTVGDLRPGDLVRTASGQLRPIRWVGRREIDCAALPNPADGWPVRIAAGAIAPGLPRRDLLVSPGHAVRLPGMDSMLVPAGVLINGATVTQECHDRVTYWHVELDTHDLVLAEGLAAESYLDVGNRDFFGGTMEEAALGAEAPIRSCLPLQVDGPRAVEAHALVQQRAVALGWTIQQRHRPDELYLLVDGRRLEPSFFDDAARFLVPTSAADVQLVSDAVRPVDIGWGPDRRLLGLRLGTLRVSDGLTVSRLIGADDRCLVTGFHAVETNEDGTRCWRWTTGRAILPSALWTGCRGSFFLSVEMAGPCLPRWIGPPAAGQDAAAHHLSRPGLATLSLVGRQGHPYRPGQFTRSLSAIPTSAARSLTVSGTTATGSPEGIVASA